MKILVSIILACLAGAQALACDVDRPIVFAGLDWDSVGFHNAVARRILEDGYGCTTDVIPGTTIPLLQGVAQGDVDIAMEVWKDAVTDVWQRALKRGQVVEIGVNFPDAVQGWYVPRYVADGMAPDLKSVTDLVRYKALFADPEEPGKGRFYNCVAGWSCEVVNTNKLRAYGLADHFTNVRPGTGAALAAAVTGAVLRREPIVFYYWSPTWLLGAHDFVRLAEPAWNAEDWAALASDPRHPRAVAYPPVEVWIGANAAFAAKAPAVVAFLAKYRTSAAMINAVLADIRATRSDDGAAAIKFLKDNPALWRSWVDAAAADKIQAKLPPGLNR
jgi:glycine betaine/proline transport system substrate-binding protein